MSGARGLLVAAPRSGAGKTSVAVGLMRAFRRRGLAVSGAKSGPDYIDPGFHAAATGRPGVNLDSFAMPPALLDALAARASEDADLLLVESAMGLFDGIGGEPGRSGAASDLCRRLALPVLLVLDVSGQSRTAAAVALGLARYDEGVRVGGVVLNRVGSERHRRQCAEAIEAVGLPVLGSVARDATLSLPERHLGLVQAGEHSGLELFIERLADTMEASVDLERVLALAAPPRLPLESVVAPSIDPPGQRIALAEDAAFSFVYPHLRDGWRRAGATILPFSPLADEAPDPSADCLWLPGGYPELHAGRLAAAATFREGVRRFAKTRPVHGECGGFMALGLGLEDADGIRHAMLGLLGHETSFRQRRMNLGYRRARLLADCPIGREGTEVRGHEFHYARVTAAGPDAPLCEISNGENRPIGPAGARRGHVSGTFFHAIAAS